MTVGIITFHRAINYGAILQAYALKRVIESLSYDCEVIDYRCKHLEDIYWNDDLLAERSLFSVLQKLSYLPLVWSKRRKFIAFSLKYLNCSPVYQSHSDLLSTISRYECFITGSDQVWNFLQTKFDKAYFLDFVDDDRRKNAYAASFGFNNIPVDYRDEYRKLLQSFNNISVREKIGGDIVKELIGRNIEVTLDPTLLISQNDWSEVAAQYTRRKNYILLYELAHSPSLLNFTTELSNLTSCEIVRINNSLNLGNKFTATYERGIGPEEYLGLFLNARYVVTNSFHGTAFSINFNKDFFFELLPSTSKVNSRLENIIEMFGLEERQIINGANKNVFNMIDYAKANKILLKAREESIGFIERVVNNN